MSPTVIEAPTMLRSWEMPGRPSELGFMSAQVVDERMQAALDTAVQELSRALVSLAAGEAQVRAQEDLLGQIAVQTYQLGGSTMIGLSMVLTSKDPAMLTSQLSSVQNVLDKEQVTVDRLQASKVLLTAQEQKVERARDAVAVRREEAAENLERRKVLEAGAEQAAQKVAGLVAARTEARQEAAKAKAADKNRLHQLKKERAKISKLKKRTRAARKKARPRGHHHVGHSDGFLSHPVRSYITSAYGMRLHPVYHRWTLHDGTDFGAGCGTPVRAAANGRVIARYYNVGYGNRVILYHGWHKGAGLATSYNHLRRYSAYVGQRVKRGDIIGFAGTTGYSTGCHLHFMVFRNGRTVNPMGWL